MGAGMVRSEPTPARSRKPSQPWNRNNRAMAAGGSRAMDKPTAALSRSRLGRSPAAERPAAARALRVRPGSRQAERRQADRARR